MLERMKFVIADWRDNFQWGFRKGQFPGEIIDWIWVFIFFISMNGNGLFQWENVIIIAFLLFLIAGWQFQEMYPNHLLTIYHLVPISRKEKLGFLWTNYWMKFVLLEGLCIIWMIPMCFCGRISILGAILWMIHFSLVQLSKGLVRSAADKEFAPIAHECMEILYVVSILFIDEMLQKGVESAMVVHIILLILIGLEVLLCIRIFQMEVSQNFNWACSYEALSEQMDRYAKEDGKAGKR